MGYVETFVLNGDQIKTTVTSDEKEIEKHISSFLHSTSKNETKVIGFDAEWFLFYDINQTDRTGNPVRTACATIQLCDGHSCLIIQINHLRRFYNWTNDLAYKSLLNFFHMTNVTFVGVGIKENFAKLEKLYHFVCRNAVELGQLAATAMKKPRLNFCGVDELAFLVNGLDLGKHRLLKPAYDYSRNPLSKELAKLGTVNVYSYYKIGSTLLQCDVVAGHNGDLPVHLW